jgi:hypothetical protein
MECGYQRKMIRLQLRTRRSAEVDCRTVDSNVRSRQYGIQCVNMLAAARRGSRKMSGQENDRSSEIARMERLNVEVRLA